MFQAKIVALCYRALVLILMLSGPPIAISLVFGLMVAIFQAATQIQEQNLAFTVKLVATILTLVILGGWLGSQIFSFSMEIFQNLQRIVA
ncbi:type III secretion system export apparatus subunit SctS [Candidatus Similichlamydia laticola]|uniref:Type III secretion inner membrane protein (YscS) n=1 Tax=Candidatus Similichlamydia laticola TaxID=2170265 RepID=A0A369KG12_9BACT|nr:type III secretion system export apparatus subunit SctS [Candidatus Similichlamydia laticola]RDB31847.1 Type III secretion inner membrane protein (YscS) [Candidatus Similichlamydia laticola]